MAKDKKTTTMTIRVDKGLKERAEDVKKRVYPRVPIGAFLEMMVEQGLNVEEKAESRKRDILFWAENEQVKELVGGEKLKAAKIEYQRLIETLKPIDKEYFERNFVPIVIGGGEPDWIDNLRLLKNFVANRHLADQGESEAWAERVAK